MLFLSGMSKSASLLWKRLSIHASGRHIAHSLFLMRGNCIRIRESDEQDFVSVKVVRIHESDEPLKDRFLFILCFGRVLGIRNFDDDPGENCVGEKCDASKLSLKMYVSIHTCIMHVWQALPIRQD